jgi:argininosuccinate lyase
MLVETGILDRATAKAIGCALEAIDRETDFSTVEYDGEVEDFFFFIERALKQRLGADVAGRLHTARSRNDIDHTLFKLAMKTRIDLFLARGFALVETLIAVARRERETLIVAYTHGQPAQPTVFGHYLAAMTEVVLRDLARMLAARDIVDRCPMGAAAITTSGFPIDRERMAALLGFARPLENSYGCIASVDYVTSTYSALELFCLHLGRPIQDLQFWSAFEVGQLYVPNAFVQISSIMPQKRNPVPIEHLRHLASQAAGHAHAVLTVLHNTPFTDMNDNEGATHQFGHAAFATADRVLALFTALIGAVRIDAAKVARNIRRSCITITELADSVVRIEGVSFRQAHEIAAAVARHVVAIEGDLTVDGYAAFVDAFAHAAGRASTIDAAGFARIVSAEHFIAVRDRLGGPAPAALEAALAGYDAELAQLREQLEVEQACERAAAVELAARFAAVCEG